MVLLHLHLLSLALLLLLLLVVCLEEVLLLLLLEDLEDLVVHQLPLHPQEDCLEVSRYIDV